jgi:hypothetical protein
MGISFGKDADAAATDTTATTAKVDADGKPVEKTIGEKISDFFTSMGALGYILILGVIAIIMYGLYYMSQHRTAAVAH